MIYTHAAAALLGAALAGTGAWQVQAWRFESRELERLHAQAAATHAAERTATTAAAAHEQDKAHDKPRIKIIRQTIEKIVERPGYAAVCLDDDGLRALSAAIKPGDAATKPGNAVP